MITFHKIDEVVKNKQNVKGIVNEKNGKTHTMIYARDRFFVVER